MSLRDKQIKEALEYDVYQSRRVFDNTIKQARAMNESATQPRKSDLENETQIQGLVDSLYNSVKKLTSQLPIVKNASNVTLKEEETTLKLYKENLVELILGLGVPLSNEETEFILYNDIDAIRRFINNLPQEVQTNEDVRKIVDKIMNAEYQSNISSNDSLTNLEKEKIQRKSAQQFDDTLAGIVSQYNGIVNIIQTKARDNGYSKNSIEYLLSMLKKVVEACKEFLSLVLSIRVSNTVTYTKSFGVIKKLVDLIEQAPPLTKMDATLLSDRYYVGEVQGEFESQRVGQYLHNQKEINENIKKSLESVKRTGRSTDVESQYLNSIDKTPIRDFSRSRREIMPGFYEPPLGRMNLPEVQQYGLREVPGEQGAEVQRPFGANTMEANANLPFPQQEEDFTQSRPGLPIPKKELKKLNDMAFEYYTSSENDDVKMRKLAELLNKYGTRGYVIPEETAKRIQKYYQDLERRTQASTGPSREELLRMPEEIPPRVQRDIDRRGYNQTQRHQASRPTQGYDEFMREADAILNPPIEPEQHTIQTASPALSRIMTEHTNDMVARNNARIEREQAQAREAEERSKFPSHMTEVIKKKRNTSKTRRPTLEPIPEVEVEGEGRHRRRMTGGVWETGIGQDPEEARHISNVLSQRASERWLASRLYPMTAYPYLPIKADNSMGQLDSFQERTTNNLVEENRQEEQIEEAPQAPQQVEALEAEKTGRGRKKKGHTSAKASSAFSSREGGCEPCGGAKKKDVKMTKKAFTKEHKKLIGMLSNTSGTLGAEAKEQLGEMKRVAPEDALQVEKTIKHMEKKKMLGGAKKKADKKQTATLQFDEKLNDVWFM